MSPVATLPAAPRPATQAPAVSPAVDADHIDRRLPRLRDVPDARGGHAAAGRCTRRSRTSRFWAIVAYNTDARPVAGVFAPRSDPAGVLVPRRRRAAVLDREPPRQGADLPAHARCTPIWRSVALILLGIFLRSLERPQTYWTFEDTLTQIGLGYTFLFLLAFASLRVQIAVFTAILVGFWVAFVLYPLPGPDFDYTAGRRAGRTGRTSIPASSRTSTRTRTSRGRSTCGS